MAGTRNRKPEAEDDRRRWIAFALLTAVAGGTLLLGAGLSSTAPVTSDERLPFEREAADPRVEPERSPPGVALPSPTAMDRLADRAAADLERMASGSREWTNQLAVLCDTTSVEELLARAGHSRDLRLLPTYVNDQTCFRICWGSYERRDQVGSDMPAHMRVEFPELYPRRRDEVLE